ncbi:MAG TPA: ABC transporter permease subunit [Clostridiales bacterium]|nr:ABC transporter permease subunit [Clostridiales bacterium]HQP68785.1 ABC transporter permease subunit [Clostridiales bacterium]
MNGLFRLTIKELLSKKIIITVFILATIFCLTLMFALNIRIGGIDSKVILNLFGNQVNGDTNMPSAEKILGYIQTGIAGTVFFISLFIALFATSGLFPDMLKKGNIDLILSKPLSRDNIFYQRFSGALAVVAATVLYLIAFSWIILSVKFGIWNFRYLFSGLIILVFFFNIFALMTLIALFVRSGVVSLLLTYFIVFILAPIIGTIAQFGVLNDSFYKNSVSILHFMLPKVNETLVLLSNIIMSQEFTLGSIWISLISGVIAVWISLVIFKRSDF